MTKSKSSAKTGQGAGARPSMPPNKHALQLQAIPGKSAGYILTGAELEPFARHAMVAATASSHAFDKDMEKPGDGDRIDAMRDAASRIGDGDVQAIGSMMAAQALTLDALFTSLASRAQLNLGQYPDAARTFMALALKAQAQSRANLEALARIHQPREQTVHHRHYHVGPDGKAVFVENAYGGAGNAGIVGQPHGQGAPVTALLGQDSQGNGVPVPSGEGQAPLQDPRRGEGERGATRKPKRVAARAQVGGDKGASKAAAGNAV